MKLKFLAGCAAILLLSAVGLSQEAQAPRVGTYTLTIVEPLPGHTNVSLQSFNESTRATGYSYSLSTPPLQYEMYLTGIPYVWKDGVQSPLPLLEGWPGAFGFWINARGDVIGVANRVGPDQAGLSRVFQTPVLWPHPSMKPIDLGILPGSISAAALAINSSGKIVGYASGGPTGNHPVIWQKRELSELSYPATYPGSVEQGQARAVNDKGEIAGVTGLPSPGPFEATLWDNTGRATHIGTLPGEAPSSQANGINNRTQIVGVSVTKIPGGLSRPFLWENGQMRDIGTLGGPQGVAWSVNNTGQIVGVARTPTNIQHAFVWEDGQMFDLNDLVVLPPDTVLVVAYHINERGCISGVATVGGVTQWFLLTPER